MQTGLVVDAWRGPGCGNDCGQIGGGTCRADDVAGGDDRTQPVADIAGHRDIGGPGGGADVGASPGGCAALPLVAEGDRRRPIPAPAVDGDLPADQGLAMQIGLPGDGRQGSNSDDRARRTRRRRRASDRILGGDDDPKRAPDIRRADNIRLSGRAGNVATASTRATATLPGKRVADRQLTTPAPRRPRQRLTLPRRPRHRRRHHVNGSTRA